nr:hypothetical protein [Tanacetum cinerariifolium]
MMYLKNTAGFTLDFFKGMSYDDIRPIFKAKFNANLEFLLKSKEQFEEEESKAIALINETPAQKAAKKRRLNKESKDVEELKHHLEIVPDEDDDIILLIERRYQLLKFTLEQMINVVRLQVEEQSEMSLELIRFTRQQLQEGEDCWVIIYINTLNLSTDSFGVDAAMELKEKHQVFIAASKDISAARQKLMLLVTTAG